MTRERLPLGVYALTLTIFCLGTSEFMIAGLLPQMAADLHTSIPAVGNLISAFAIGMLVGAPVMTLLTLRLPRRVTLLAASTVFGLAHLIPVFSHSYPVILGSRVLAAVAAATFWAVSAVTVVTLVRSDQIARGMAALLGGMTLANIAGVPLGTFLGNQFGWRATFLCIGIAALLATIVTRIAVPETGEHTTDSLATVAKRELRVIRKPRLLLALATIAAFQAAVFCTFSYLAPLLTDVSGLPESVVPAVLLGFGVGSFIGLNLGGRYADRNLLANVLISLVALAVSLLVLRASASHSTLVVAAVVLFGITGFSIASAINARVFVHAAEAPTMASAFNVTAFNVGNAVGPWLGGLVITAGLGLTAPIYASVGLSVLAFALALCSWRLEREPTPAIECVPVTCDLA
ncbi:DHA1 family chloramphenicol resistance protein-like MFS transporter [Branchiibius hedensis]|uniref:MFS transporter, DHA1 family, chloramphenicol resistance protein n=1 Tax=Branchiibius hedensis TaxID=672460 RepID=A0A2Y8ZUA9_9MICO|nr:Cmx/CmrA family chloramphenicol efflux MFS transporter [Branchiibius hedensis]PWJ27189.1 DHA1 family chloramphenicol resistance protein-like MFS transporter [Branchiibius hedensis]SSA36000.1 MFS transporter, DHA1 family, chloramphenicol resistance protein [Branchiibius hedensis]